MEFHWCICSSFGIQPDYEAPGNLQVELQIALWLTSGEWGCLLFSGPNLALPQPMIKKFLNKFCILSECFYCCFRFKQANFRCSISSISKPISWCNHNATDQAIAMDRYQSYFRKVNIFSVKQKGAVRNDQKVYSHLIYDFCMRVKTFKVATSLYIFSTTQPSMAQQRKQMKNKFLIIFKT